MALRNNIIKGGFIMLKKICFILFLSFFVITGCESGENTDDGIITMGRTKEDELIMSDDEREMAIKECICKINGVDNAWVIASGDNIVIGIETSVEDKEDIDTIKFLVKKETEKCDRWAGNISITTKNDIVDMIKNVRR